MKIDIFNHIFPQSYFDKMNQVAPDYKDMGKRVRNIPVLVDLDMRMKMMDQFGDYCQVLSIAAPPLEVITGPDASPDLARAANDGLAEICQKYPERFPTFTASLPMNNPDAAVAEANRAISQLGARGVQLFTNVDGKPLDEPEFLPLFDEMAKLDLPIWMHPARGANSPDYRTEEKSKFEIWFALGWPYETGVAMARMVFSGFFDRLPNLKIITHHCGGIIPYLEGRVGTSWDQLGSRTSDEDYTAVLKRLKKRPIDYFRMFYADTAEFGASGPTKCGLDFFGADNILFASDSPFDPEKGPMYIRETIKVIDGIEMSAEEREKIYRGNAERLLKISVN